jgi:hypothetical protein
MSAYEIKRWDAVTGNNIRKFPMIYVEPDDSFLSFARANDFAVMCEISGTGMSCYDSDPHNPAKIPGVVSRSSVTPNCRPNFYDKTEYYVVTLLTPWMGYPSKSRGNVKFFGMKQGMLTEIPQQKDPLKKSGDVEKRKAKSPPTRASPAGSKSGGRDGMSGGNKMAIGIGVGALLLLLAGCIGLIIHLHRK